MADSTMTAACHVAGSFRGMDRPETDGVVDELHQEVVLLRITVVDEEPRVDPAPALKPVPRVTAPDPPPPRDHLPPVRVAAEEFARKSPPRRAAATPRRAERAWGAIHFHDLKWMSDVDS